MTDPPLRPLPHPQSSRHGRDALASWPEGPQEIERIESPLSHGILSGWEGAAELGRDPRWEKNPCKVDRHPAGGMVSSRKSYRSPISM